MAYAETAHGKLYYEVFDQVAPWETQRESIVFHHGIGADPGIWTEWLPLLTDRYRVVRFDMRGYGRSHIPAADFRWTIDLLALDLLAVADAAGAGRAHFVGESIGGTVVLQLAITHPQRVATLTVSNGAHVGGSIQGVQAWERTIDEQGIKAWSDQFMRDRFVDGALDESKYAWYARQQESWQRDSILNALRALVGADLRPRLPAVTCPVLLMHGDRSPFIPVEIMVDLYRRLGNARLQIFPNARHGLPFSHAKACAQALRGFLAEARARKQSTQSNLRSIES
jgi:pimeloyl-ACP methyl ester carboxylesterase